MYIALAWTPLSGSDPVAIEGEILAAIESLAFVNYFTPYDGFFLANVRRRETRFQVQLLHDLLLPLCAGRFSYVITVSPSFWEMATSPDVPADVCDEICGYET